MYTSTNLQTVYSVQPASGQDSWLFSSYEEAEKQRNQWYEEVEQLFLDWENGKASFAPVESRLESDLEGGCHVSYVLADYACPSGIDTHTPFSMNAELWQENQGYDSIKWGNPALDRPVKA